MLWVQVRKVLGLRNLRLGRAPVVPERWRGPGHPATRPNAGAAHYRPTLHRDADGRTEHTRYRPQPNADTHPNTGPLALAQPHAAVLR